MKPTEWKDEPVWRQLKETGRYDLDDYLDVCLFITDAEANEVSLFAGNQVVISAVPSKADEDVRDVILTAVATVDWLVQ